MIPKGKTRPGDIITRTPESAEFVNIRTPINKIFTISVVFNILLTVIVIGLPVIANFIATYFLIKLSFKKASFNSIKALAYQCEGFFV